MGCSSTVWLRLGMAAVALGLLPAQAAVEVSRLNYRGWPDAIMLANDQAEIVVVPSIGRLMRFALRWDDNPLWENPALFGTVPDGQSPTWLNFGGCKVWPAEQRLWPKVMPRAWPPDSDLDGSPHRAELLGDGGLRLTSPVSRHYGVRCVRVFRLHRQRAELVIEQRLQKLEGEPVRCTVWNVTQCRRPDAVFMPLAKGSRFPGGYVTLSNPDKTPANARVIDDILAIRQDDRAASKYGGDHPGGWLAWLRDGLLLSEHYTYQPDGDYPDGGCVAEVFTADAVNGGYIELELLSPQADLAVGESLEHTIRLRLQRIAAPGDLAGQAAAVREAMQDD